MTLAFVTNFVHHHQLPLADEFYRIIGENYHYIATQPLPEWLVKGGYDPSLDRNYIIRTYHSEDEMQKARRLIDESDVVIAGDSPLIWTLKRKSENRVTFHNAERWLKKVNIHAVSPRALYNIYTNYFKFRHNRTYMLCASAFTAQDVHRYGCFPNRCFKWGYITAVDKSIETSSWICRPKEYFMLMWCSRFLVWKHPELPIQLAARLKKKGYNFVIDMFGSGEKLDWASSMAKQYGVDDCVKFCGNRPNQEILREMRNHQIFLFTSDRYEGWGAVLNEAMANGCVPVASDAIGSAPYLIKDGENGFLFQSCSLDSLEEKVCALLDDQEKAKSMSNAALDTMQNVWSPRVAAENFLELAQHALNGTLNNYTRTEGPASWEK